MLAYVFGLSRVARGPPTARGSPTCVSMKKIENTDGQNRHFPKVFGIFFIFQELVRGRGFSAENRFLSEFLSVGVPREARAKPQKPRRSKL